ncbi:helix-turn-helix transcriptional regulator [Marinicella gelatinilytica]|uniref:helix-turn-helix transcriptional regulator n=1 Tax=Marinicella gelatinilytica TaxID=2996017 RepID=UPI002260B43A|nr:AlpA family transcriptional regulator [Marinicella gelatinilytica]MCX7546084.1 AlpA family transcriptional regulator [Marinicella gelatinilytica]
MNTQTQYLRPKAVCELLSISKATLYRWTNKGHFPKPVKLGDRAVGYDIVDIQDFLKERKGVSDHAE